MQDDNLVITDSPEWQECKQLWLRALQTDQAAFSSVYADNLNYPDTKWQERLDASKNRKGSRALYARVDGKLVGMIGALWEDKVTTNHWATVFGMYVDPEYRCRQIGQKLIAALETDLKSNKNFRKLKLGVNAEQLAAVKLYTKMGFTSIGVYNEDLHVGDKFYDVIIMEKYL